MCQSGFRPVGPLRIVLKNIQQNIGVHQQRGHAAPRVKARISSVVILTVAAPRNREKRPRGGVGPRTAPGSGPRRPSRATANASSLLTPLLTAPLASPYFLGFLGVAKACQKSPMKSRREVDIIHHYQTQHTGIRRCLSYRHIDGETMD